ncbi:TetR family transcriptional regulator [Nocardia brasiliensis]|uniref:TetR family transcriptional regulator n=1 Tax=Nocardia brasiliensis TaxID=37326 RepID=A0A6G9XTR6_NOCBR|nr:TetR/AcrR family transcriptional regulator [Nocardia brasiliensis]QIS04295.1 TetR family transcriptional regulator [Nocardia brasiliensis]
MPRTSVPLVNLFGRAVSKVVTFTPAGPELVRVYETAIRVLAERGADAATMDDVAAGAGMSRATLFRRFGGRDALFEAAVAHTLRGFLAEITSRYLTVTDPTERIAEAFVACLRLRRQLLSDNTSAPHSAELLAMLTVGDPTPLTIGHRFIAARIRAGQSEGALPPGDPDLQADAIIRITMGYLLLPPAGLDLDDDTAARDLARRVIAPLVTTPMS